MIVLLAILPVFSIVGIGALLRIGGVLSPMADKTLMALVVTLLYPCLYLDLIIGNSALMQWRNLLAAPLTGFGLICLGFGVAWFGAKAIGLECGRGLRTFSFATGVFNYGYIPIPLIAALFADRATSGVLLVHNIGVDLAVWSIGIVLLGGRFGRQSLRQILNPPVIALLIAVCLNFTGAWAHVPAWLSVLISQLGACAIPLGLIVAGGTIVDLVRQGGLFSEWRVPVTAICTRLAILPILFLAIAMVIPKEYPELRRVVIVQAAMPSGIFPIVMARHFGGEPMVAVKVVVYTTLVSVVTLPLWIKAGLFLLGNAE